MSEGFTSSKSESDSRKRISGIKEKSLIWEKRIDEFNDRQSHNPFSDKFIDTEHLKKGDQSYGKPVVGSQTEARGVQAQEWVDREINRLQHVFIALHREKCEATKSICAGEVVATFGDLFARYQDISNSLVGILKRARQRGVVKWNTNQERPCKLQDRDMLYQGRDDNVEITLSILPDTYINQIAPITLETVLTLQSSVPTADGCDGIVGVSNDVVDVSSTTDMVPTEVNEFASEQN